MTRDLLKHLFRLTVNEQTLIAAACFRRGPRPRSTLCYHNFLVSAVMAQGYSVWFLFALLFGACLSKITAPFDYSKYNNSVEVRS
jgi:hypothetical protein